GGAEGEGVAEKGRPGGEWPGEYGPAGGAETLEGGNDLAPAIDVGGNRIGHTDAADEQRGQSNQSEKLAQSFQGAGNLRRGIAPIAHGKAGLWHRLPHARAKGDQVVATGGAGELHSVAPADQTAWINQAGAAHGVDGNEY